MTSRSIILAAALAGGSAVAQEAAPGVPVVYDFEAAPSGAQTVCTPGLTGEGGPVDWQIVEDPTAPSGTHVIAELSGDDTSYRFPLCLFDVTARNVEVSVWFKPISGEVDQAAGLMARVQGPNDYYITRANALEGNVRFYTVVDGGRDQLEGEGLDIAAGQWQKLGLRLQDEVATVLLNDQVLFTEEDDTFAEAGAVGLWTKADSLTYFDDLTITPLPE